ncbi:MAG: reverse transcriptase domain-containing protein, partial [Cetobacterium sp.]
QGGGLSPLLANVVLNELDWWIHRQWAGINLKREYSNSANKEKSLRIKTKLDEVKIVRYADDFKLYCRNIGAAQKFFKLTKLFLKNRLNLEISKKKSKIVNLIKQSSEFLGIRITTIKNRDKRTVRTFISNKSKEKIKKTIAKEIEKLHKYRNNNQAKKYNVVIAGIQNYYRIATMVSQDMAKIGYILGRKLKSRFGKRSHIKDFSYLRRYKTYNFKVWNVSGVTLYTIGACKYKIVKSYSIKKQTFDLVDEELEKTSNLKVTEWEIIKARLRLLRNSTCEITKEYIAGRDRFYVHHIIPKQKGGKDDIENLMFLKYEFKRLLSSENPERYLPENRIYQNLLKTLSK